MIYNGYYNLDVGVNNNSLELGVTNYSFNLHDSIHSFYPTCKIKLNDILGVYYESLLTMEGLVYNILYGTEQFKQNLLKTNYVIVSDQLPQTSKRGILNGEILIDLVHEYYALQNQKTKYWKNTISSIVNQLSEDYIFLDKNIIATLGTTEWYQLQMDQKTFIQDVLLPNAYNSNRTPYFCFIGLDNKFNFVDYNSLIKANITCTLNYKPFSAETSDIYSIYDIKPFRSGSTVSKNYRNRKLYHRSLVDGKYSSSNDYISQYPVKYGDQKVPIIYDKTLQTSYENLHWQYTEPGDKEAYEGRKIYKQKNGLFLEKFVVQTMFNPILSSGKTININVSAFNSQNDSEYLLYLSGKYLIEDCIHTWNGQLRQGATELIVSRKFVNVPKSYNIGSLMVS